MPGEAMSGTGEAVSTASGVVPGPSEARSAPGQGEATPAPGAAVAAAGQEPAAPSTAPLPLADLSADFLGGFFELCFPDKRLLQLCRELGITTPGYRLEALPPEQVARVLADEYLAAQDVRGPIEKAVREALFDPALEAEKLTATAIDGLAALVYDCLTADPMQQMARVVWRALIDPGEQRLELAQIAVEDGIKLLEAAGPAPKKAAPPNPTKKEARAALKQAERAAKELQAMREQLASARVAIADREQKLAEQKAELHKLREGHARLAGEVARLTAAGEGRALGEARRAQDESRSLAEKLRVAEEELDELRESVQAAERREKTAALKPAEPAASAPDELPSAEEAAEFLVPVLTREFYDSIERWDRRMQRAAFEKVHLLSQNWRHGSLRALQLEGVPGYYRIRIATDVRLIYRREGSQLEILSLIDREDLDRYIRQARTRVSDQRGKSEAPGAR
jgi:hypothetical protein